MTETEYIDATNLAKLRCSIAMLKDTLFMDEEGELWRIRTIRSMAEKIRELEEVVKFPRTHSS